MDLMNKIDAKLNEGYAGKIKKHSSKIHKIAGQVNQIVGDIEREGRGVGTIDDLVKEICNTIADDVIKYR